MVKIISLTKGRVAFVDDDDFDYLCKESWHCTGLPNRQYVSCSRRDDDAKKTIYMHRLIMNAPVGMDVDHINGNRFDNRKANLRVCTRSNNLMNRGKGEGLSSIYKGVCFCINTGRWRAIIRVNGKSKCLGRYDTEEQVAIAYNKAAADYFGEFSRLNQVEGINV